MKHENNIDALLKLAIQAESTANVQDRQTLKMKAGKVVAELYPAKIVERVKFLNGRRHRKDTKLRAI